MIACCFIGCEQESRFYGWAGYENDYQACADHVDDLMSDGEKNYVFDMDETGGPAGFEIRVVDLR